MFDVWFGLDCVCCNIEHLSNIDEICNSMLSSLTKSFFISEFGYEATKWLIEQRSIVGIGTECPDIELTQKGEVKLLLSTRGHFSIMQLTNVDQLPMRGFSVTMAPLKLQVKFIYSEKATKFCKISTNYLSYLCTASQIIGGDFAKFCGLLRIYVLVYISWLLDHVIFLKLRR